MTVVSVLCLPVRFCRLDSITVALSLVYMHCSNLSIMLFIPQHHVCSMAALLSKFRIDYSDVIVIDDVTKKAEQSTRDTFSEMIAPFKKDDESDIPGGRGFCSPGR